MADTGSGLDAGHRRLLHAGPDQSRPAPGDQQIHQPVRRHQNAGALMTGILQNIHDVRVAAHGGNPLLQRLYDGSGGADCLFPAAENADVAAFHCQCRRIGGDVGAALVNDRHQSQGHLLFIDGHTVGVVCLRQNPPGVIRQLHRGPDTLRHSSDAALIQPQPVQHHIGNVAPGRFQIRFVAGQDLRRVFHEAVRHGGQEAVFRLRVRVPEGAPSGFRFPNDIQCGHLLTFFAKNRVPMGSPSAMS